MGIGTNTLGYGHWEVDKAVKRALRSGNMSTLNCPEEVYLAEKLIEINPWAQMVRFARTGGEANAIAKANATAHANAIDKSKATSKANAKSKTHANADAKANAKAIANANLLVLIWQDLSWFAFL